MWPRGDILSHRFHGGFLQGIRMDCFPMRCAGTSLGEELCFVKLFCEFLKDFSYWEPKSTSQVTYVMLNGLRLAWTPRFSGSYSRIMKRNRPPYLDFETGGDTGFLSLSR